MCLLKMELASRKVSTVACLVNIVQGTIACLLRIVRGTIACLLKDCLRYCCVFFEDGIG